MVEDPNNNNSSDLELRQEQQIEQESLRKIDGDYVDGDKVEAETYIKQLVAQGNITMGDINNTKFEIKNGVRGKYINIGGKAYFISELHIHQYIDNNQVEIPPPFMAPKPPDHFVKRPAEYEKIINHLIRDKSMKNSRIVSIHGAGGFGKTTLAKAVCHDARIRGAFSDGILWVEVQQSTSMNKIASLFSTIHLELTGEYIPLNSDSLQIGQSLVRNDLMNRNVLLVLDDVWDFGDLVLFQSILGNNYMLVTTRFKNLPENALKVNVDEMKEQEALELLTSRLIKTNLESHSVHTFSSLLAKLGNWPLLLDLVGYHLKRFSIEKESIEDAVISVVEIYENSLEGFNIRNMNARHSAINSTMGISLQLFEQHVVNEYLELAIFPEDTDIPIEVIKLLWNKEGIHLENQLLNLSDAALLKYNGKKKSVRIQTGIRKYQRDMLKDIHSVYIHFIDAIGHPASITNRFILENYIFLLLGAGKDKIEKLIQNYNENRSLSNQKLSKIEQLLERVVEDGNQEFIEYVIYDLPETFIAQKDYKKLQQMLANPIFLEQLLQQTYGN